MGHHRWFHNQFPPFFPVLHRFLALGELQACPFPDVVLMLTSRVSYLSLKILVCLKIPVSYLFYVYRQVNCDGSTRAKRKSPNHKQKADSRFMLHVTLWRIRKNEVKWTTKAENRKAGLRQQANHAKPYSQLRESGWQGPYQSNLTETTACHYFNNSSQAVNWYFGIWSQVSRAY